MKKRWVAKVSLLGMMLLTIGLAGCSLSTDKVNITKEESGEAVKQVKLDVNHADLVIKESSDSKVQASLSGLKGSADETVLKTSVKGSVLEVKAAYIEKSYIDLNKETINDKNVVKLVLSLPKKQYNSIQVKSPDVESKIEILTKDGSMKKFNKKTKSANVNSIFGTVNVVR